MQSGRRSTLLLRGGARIDPLTMESPAMAEELHSMNGAPVMQGAGGTFMMTRNGEEVGTEGKFQTSEHGQSFDE